MNNNQFKFIYKNEHFTDSTIGTYTVIKDTLILTYGSININEVNKENANINALISVGHLFSKEHFLMRPQKLLIAGNKLLYLENNTHKPVIIKINNTNQQIYLERE